MSNKKRRISPELPQTGNALEVPNYVIPTTDLEYREIMEQTDPRRDKSGQGCAPEQCGEDCRK